MGQVTVFRVSGVKVYRLARVFGSWSDLVWLPDTTLLLLKYPPGVSSLLLRFLSRRLHSRVCSSPVPVFPGCCATLLRTHACRRVFAMCTTPRIIPTVTKL